MFGRTFRFNLAAPTDKLSRRSPFRRVPLPDRNGALPAFGADVLSTHVVPSGFAAQTVAKTLSRRTVERMLREGYRRQLTANLHSAPEWS